MRAIVITRPGPPEVLQVSQAAPPDCGPDQFSMTPPIFCDAGQLTVIVEDETGAEIALPLSDEFAFELFSGELITTGTSAIYFVPLAGVLVCL